MLVSRPQGEQGEDGKAEGPPGPPGDRVRAPPTHPLDDCQGGAPSPSCVGSWGGGGLLRALPRAWPRRPGSGTPCSLLLLSFHLGPRG